MKAFHELGPHDLTPEILQDEIRSRGYVLIRNVLPQDTVRQVLTDVTDVLSTAGWLAERVDPRDRVPAGNAAYGDPDPVFKKVYQQVFNLESVHALPHQAALHRVMTMLVGDQVLVHPKPIGRLIFPNCDRLVVHAHQDYEFMGGDTEFFTVWMPLHDCPPEIGPLQILEGSHRFGIQTHDHENLHVPEIPMERAAGEQWVGGHIHAGDVLIFHSLTVHAASPNLSRQMRLSIDCRFQDARRSLNPSNLAFGGTSGKSWEKTYSNWKSDALQFYWRDLSLNFKPSLQELEELAVTADSAEARARYTRVLDCVRPV